MDSRVSVIVPVYNVENYVGKCLESIINQTYVNIEIIVINDCSTDNSLKVIKAYKEKNDVISIIDLEKNMGVSNARNLGIKAATGEYIMFCDADDWYEKDAVEVLMQEVKCNGADFVVANHYITKGKSKRIVNISEFFKEKNISKQEIIAYMNLSSSVKLMKRNLFIDNDIFYPVDIKRCEEFTVIPIIAYLAEKPIAINNVIYNYYQRENSASNTKVIDTAFFNITFERFIEKIDREKYKEEIEFRAINHLLYGELLVMLKSGANKKEMKSKIDNFLLQYPKFMKNKYLKKYNKAKLIFVFLLRYHMLYLAKMYAKLHELLTTKFK